MSALAAADIAGFRALAEELALPDAYTLLRATASSDGMGGQSVTTATVEGGMGLLMPGATRPEERAIADRLGYQAPYIAILPFATLATPSDRLTIAGRTLEIGGVFKGGEWGVLARLVCEERSN